MICHADHHLLNTPGVESRQHPQASTHLELNLLCSTPIQLLLLCGTHVPHHVQLLHHTCLLPGKPLNILQQAAHTHLVQQQLHTHDAGHSAELIKHKSCLSVLVLEWPCKVHQPILPTQQLDLLPNATRCSSAAAALLRYYCNKKDAIVKSSAKPVDALS